MMTTTQTQTKVADTYQDPKSLATRGLRYFIDSRGRHVVAIHWPAGEDIGPDFFRHATIEEARQTWAKCRERFNRDGYTVLSQRRIG